MKRQAKSVAAKKPRAKASTKRVVTAKAAKTVLPAWVIGCYDGPSDGKLSTKKAYEK